MHKQYIGIWGFGVVGKSALSYFTKQGATCTLFDKRTLTSEEHALLAQHDAIYLPEQDIEHFFSEQTGIIASPGIDINPYKDRAHFICELDIFAPAWKRPLITVTGSVGKTSTTTLIGKLFNETRVAVGGNIGIPMLSFIEHQEQYDYAVLEL